MINWVGKNVGKALGWFGRKVASAGLRLSKASLAPSDLPNLEGDRHIEWGFISGRIGRFAPDGANVLDLGCGDGYLSLVAASLCRRVLAIDLMPKQFVSPYRNVEFQQVDVMALQEPPASFDLMLCCSVLEHIGLSGRYGSDLQSDGDLQAMRKLRELLKPSGHILLTLPVGHDAVVSPYHRIYGAKRLPRLIEGYSTVEKFFWRKQTSNHWSACTQAEAVDVCGNDHYYALGLLVLRREE